MAHSVVFSPEAERDLNEIYDYIAARGGAQRALAYVERIEATCNTLSQFPDRGSRRDAVYNGLRIITFDKRVTIAFRVSVEVVTIDRILGAGRDLGTALDPN